MSALAEVWSQIRDNWVILTALAGGLFYLQKIRDEEALRSRLKIVSDSYESFSRLNGVIQKWASPLEFKGEDKDADFSKAIDEVWEKARVDFNRASLLLHPKVVAEMESVFSDMNRMGTRYASYKMYAKSNQEAGGAYTEKSQKAWDEAKEELPAKISATHKRLHHEFRVILNGRFTVWWWGLTHRETKKKA